MALLHLGLPATPKLRSTLSDKCDADAEYFAHRIILRGRSTGSWSSDSSNDIFAEARVRAEVYSTLVDPRPSREIALSVQPRVFDHSRDEQSWNDQFQAEKCCTRYTSSHKH